MGLCSSILQEDIFSSISLNREGDNKVVIENETFRKIVEVKKNFEEIKIKSNSHFQDNKKQLDYICNFKTYINELNVQINQNKEQMNISINDYISPVCTNSKHSKLDEVKSSLIFISGKIDIYKNTVTNCKNNEIKNLETLIIEIKDLFNEIDKKKECRICGLFCFPKKEFFEVLDNITQTIKQKLKQIENLLSKLEQKKKEYLSQKKEIEEKIEIAKKIFKDFISKYDEIMKKIGSSRISRAMMLKNSLLLEIREFGTNSNIFDSKFLFTTEGEKNENNIKESNLIRKKWNETCYIKEEFDIYEVKYELKAVGLEKNAFYSKCSFGFYYDTEIEILEFKIDGKDSKYNYKNYSLEFDIHLANLESNQIYLKYKESPQLGKLTKEEIEERNFVRNKYYGLSKNIAGDKAKFTLIIDCDFEVISFKENFFIPKNNENNIKEYVWGGIVPPEGKRTIVGLSKSEAKWKFLLYEQIINTQQKNIEKTTLKVPFSFEGGNNQIINIEYKSKQTNNLQKDEKNRCYNVNFFNINSSVADFSLKGELKNRCKGEWICDVTDEEIEKNIPIDYKENKEKFKEIVENILKEYKEKHFEETIQIPEYSMIGKWVNENIKYNLKYHGKNEIGAMKVYEIREGVCEHFTKLYNALLYSIGYQVMYVSGYAVSKKSTFEKADGHAWSLIKIDNKWLPFDSTWGIFSGKLPVCHIFQNYFGTTIHTSGIDSIKFGERKASGNFIK